MQIHFGGESGLVVVATVPVLLRRMLADLGAGDVVIARPFRVKRTQIVRQGEIERAVTQAIRARENPGSRRLSGAIE